MQTLSFIGFGEAACAFAGGGAQCGYDRKTDAPAKGIEALAAEAAGVTDAVAASLDASWSHEGWAARAAYNLERMMAHGLRRAAEMEEVVKTVDALGTVTAMSRGTVLRQRAIGARGLAPTDGLAAKLAQLLSAQGAT